MRYPPIPREQWTEEQAAVARDIMDGPRGEVRGPFVPLLHAPKLAASIQELGEVIRFGTSIPNNLLEIAVCMTARARDCPNIWESHSRLALKAGVVREIIAALAKRERPTAMNADEALVFAFCSELLGGDKVSDTTFDAVVSRWGKTGAMELAGICGYYSMLACVLNAAERPLVDTKSVPFGVASI
jgi:4-carboxymuconolactone decarboxylase